MFSRAALTVFVLSAAELLLLGAAVRTWGAAVVAAAVLVSAAIGAVVIRRQPRALFSERARPADDGSGGVDPSGLLRLAAGGTAGSGQLTDRSLRVLAGVLLVIPGILTSAVGALLTVPPVRAVGAGYVRRRLPSPVSWLGASVPANGRSPHRRDVVDVDVVAEDMPTSARSELH